MGDGTSERPTLTPDAYACLVEELGLPLDWFYRSRLALGDRHMTDTEKNPAVPAAPTALEVQKGGDHYKAMGMQPVEFCMKNGWDCCAFSALKYLSRHRRKGGKLDAEKALHFVELRAQLLGDSMSPGMGEVRMVTYTVANKDVLHEIDVQALNDLSDWIESGEEADLTRLKQRLVAIVDEYH